MAEKSAPRRRPSAEPLRYAQPFFSTTPPRGESRSPKAYRPVMLPTVHFGRKLQLTPTKASPLQAG
jgi:hypothetical protein